MTATQEFSLTPTAPRPRVVTAHEPGKSDEKTARYRFDLKPRSLTVTDTARLSRTMRRIRFSSDDNFDGFPSISPEDHVKLFFDLDDDGDPVLPSMKDGRWSPRGLTYRDFTIRWLHPGLPAVDIDFVLHDHGVAGRWAATAEPGDRLGMLGPRGAHLVKDVFPWYVMAVDETALPALARWLEVLRPDVPVTAYVEVADSTSQFELPSRAALDVHWLHRGESEPGTTTLLADAIANHAYPDRDGFLWAAGEALSIKPIRRWATQELGLQRDNWDVNGYWRRGTINHDHHAEDD